MILKRFPEIYLQRGKAVQAFCLSRGRRTSGAVVQSNITQESHHAKRLGARASTLEAYLHLSDSERCAFQRNFALESKACRETQAFTCLSQRDLMEGDTCQHFTWKRDTSALASHDSPCIRA